jgi:2-amino-4-hydroxy-6-hydroxymethyldihydropteridine diphosphokinase
VTTVYLGLGSNLGDRRANLERAMVALRSHPAVQGLVVSSFIETEPVGGPPDQRPYLNGAARLETDLEPQSLLAELKSIEHALGRRKGPRWGPRLIDLDILLYGNIVLETEDLVIPHPRLRERLFVLRPLAEIAPQARDPVTRKAIKTLLAALESSPSSGPATPPQP